MTNNFLGIEKHKPEMGTIFRGLGLYPFVNTVLICGFPFNTDGEHDKNADTFTFVAY